jgi:hypothetical protein
MGSNGIYKLQYDMMISHIFGYTIEVEGCVTAAACCFSLQFEDGGLPRTFEKP